MMVQQRKIDELTTITTLSIVVFWQLDYQAAKIEIQPKSRDRQLSNFFFHSNHWFNNDPRR